jgi:hypothetical protein
VEDWRRVWRNGVVPQLTNEGLESLRDALLRDDGSILQGATTRPPPLQCVQDWAVEAACGLSWVGWKVLGLSTVGEVEEWFARTCYEADKRLGEPAGIHHFLTWFDRTYREEMRKLLAKEITNNLSERAQAS